MSTDFRDTSARHFEDAEILLAQTRAANADHLFGLSAECSLKAVMLALGMAVNTDGAPADRGPQGPHAGALGRLPELRSGPPCVPLSGAAGQGESVLGLDSRSTLLGAGCDHSAGAFEPHDRSSSVPVELGEAALRRGDLMNFNDALGKATQLAQARLPDLKEHVFLVRDLHGRIRILLGKRRQQASEFYPHIQALITDITQALGTYAYAADDLVMYREDLKSIQLPDDRSSAVLAENGNYKVCLHDRLLMGAEWSASPPVGAPTIKRFTLFSMKGGVGRSTTASILAWHLAQKGKRVLVFDLDLESPGVGATLLGPNLPRFGIVDWFVEDALGQGAAVLSEMVRQSALATGSGTMRSWDGRTWSAAPTVTSPGRGASRDWWRASSNKRRPTSSCSTAARGCTTRALPWSLRWAPIP